MTDLFRQGTAIVTVGRWKYVTLTGLLVLVGLYVSTRVIWDPIVTQDGINYLEHSNDLLGLGTVQLGFRQIGYPAWLATVDAITQILPVQPLALTVVLQRAMLFLSVGMVAWVLRWWSIPLVLVLLTPSVVAYTNFVLTEAIAIPIAIIGAAAAIALASNEHRAGINAWIVVAAAVGIALPAIRLHYVVISLAIAATILWAKRKHDGSDRTATIGLAAMGLLFAVLVGAMTYENYHESGVLLPSIGSERAMFWAAWVSVGLANEQAVAAAMPDVYLEGVPHAFIIKMNESGLSAGDQRSIYASALERIFAATGVDKTSTRFRSLSGVLFGARLDDIGPGVEYVAAHTVFGRSDQDPLIGSLKKSWILPILPSPSLAVSMAWLVPAMISLSFVLLAYSQSRLLPILALGVVSAYGFVGFIYLLDNLRYLVPGYLFAIALILGALREYWTYDRAATGSA